MGVAKRIKIKNPFYGAGSIYGWTKDGFHIYGIGINTEFLRKHTTLEIELSGKTTIVNTIDIRIFAEKYNSFRDIHNSFIQVAVVSVSLLDPSLKSIKKEIDNQKTIFDFIKK